jgi:hypothetical protein
MKTKSALIIATVLVALAALMTGGILFGMERAQAQDEIPPPIPDRISFGMIGITQGQTVRVNVVNTLPPPTGDSQPQICRVVLTFLDAEGRGVRSRDGSIIRRAFDLEPGRAAFLDLNADHLQNLPAGDRFELRVAVIHPPVNFDRCPSWSDSIVPSVEVFNNVNGRTVIFVGNPGAIRAFNPQPTPPAGDE